LNDPFSEVQARALDILWELARGQSPESVTAIQILAADPRLTSDRCVELLELASTNKLGSERLRYIVLTASARLLPLDKDSLIEKEVKLQEGKPLADTLDFLRWLYTMNEYDQVLKLMPKDKALRMPELFPIYVEVLAAKKRWKDLQDMMRTSPTLPISPTDLALLKARCAQGLGDTPAIIKGHLEEACRRALGARDMANVIRSTGIAEGLGFDDVALETLRNAVSIPKYQLTMLERILIIQTKQRDSAGMLATSREIIGAKPGLRLHQENTYYLSLLIGEEIETAAMRTASLAKEGKIAEGAHRILQALAAYRVADYETMKSVLAVINPEVLTTGQRAVYAGMLSATGETARAFAIAEKLRRALLLREEEKFLDLAL